MIPLFPLGTVLVPGLVLPLHVFEPRYRRLVADLREADDDRGFGVVAIREGPRGRRDRREGAARGGHASRCCARGAPPTAAATSSPTATPGSGCTASSTPARPTCPARSSGSTSPDGGEPEAVAVAALGVVRRFDEYRETVAGTGAVEAAQMLALPDDARSPLHLVAVARWCSTSASASALLESPRPSSGCGTRPACLGRETSLLRDAAVAAAVDLARTPERAERRRDRPRARERSRHDARVAKKSSPAVRRPRRRG